MSLRYPPRTFKLLVFKWLREHGYKYCWRCKTVKSLVKDYSLKGETCRACKNDRMKVQYATNPNKREYCLAQSKKQVAEGYHKEYQQRPEVREREQKHYFEVKAKDPEALRASWRKYDATRRAKKKQQTS